MGGFPPKREKKKRRHCFNYRFVRNNRALTQTERFESLEGRIRCSFFDGRLSLFFFESNPQILFVVRRTQLRGEEVEAKGKKGKKKKGKRKEGLVRVGTTVHLDRKRR